MKNMELIISMFFRTILNLNDIPWDNGILSKPWDSAQISARVFFLEGYHRPAAIKYDPKDIPLGALGFYGN